MWRPRSPREAASDRASNTISPAKTASQAASGSVAVCRAQRAKWPVKHHFFASFGLIARKLFGHAASVCRRQTGAKAQKSGRQSSTRFSKKWTLTRPNMAGLAIATRTKTTTSICEFAELAATECYGIKSTARAGQSKLAVHWRLNLT